MHWVPCCFLWAVSHSVSFSDRVSFTAQSGLIVSALLAKIDCRCEPLYLTDKVVFRGVRLDYFSITVLKHHD